MTTEYHSRTIQAVDGLYRLKLSIENMQQLVKEMGDVTVREDQVITILLYANEKHDTYQHRIILCGHEFDKLMEWMKGMIQRESGVETA